MKDIPFYRGQIIELDNLIELIGDNPYMTPGLLERKEEFETKLEELIREEELALNHRYKNTIDFILEKFRQGIKEFELFELQSYLGDIDRDLIQKENVIDNDLGSGRLRWAKCDFLSKLKEYNIDFKFRDTFLFDKNKNDIVISYIDYGDKK